MVRGRLVVAAIVAALLFGCRAKSEPAAAGGSAPPRAPAVAGSFYPAEPERLRAAVSAFLAEAREGGPVVPGVERVFAILVPHAGYQYSGSCAARGFAALEGLRFDTAILLGSPHAAPVRGAAVYAGAGFQTPVGVVAVDTELARAIVASSPLVREDAAPHVAEHSLEVELPFLVQVRREARIVPILVSGDKAALDAVAGAIVEAVSKRPGGFDRVVLVISSDLAHYPNAADAEASDREILEAFCSLDPAGLLAADRAIMARKLAGQVCTMCALDAAYVGLKVARAAGATAARLLDARTSAEAGVAGAAADRVVGYGAVAVSRPAPAVSIPLREPLGDAEQELLLRIARESIAQYLRNRSVAAFQAPAGASHLLEERGCFVTLSKRTARGLELRGCIGTHEPSVPLVELVPRMALASAFRDPRFVPVTARELPELEIEISVYRTGIVPIASAEEFVVGEQGIILSVGGAQATFLPQVATEQGWDRVATLEQLSLKAGLDRDAWKRKDARFAVYVTQAFRERGE